MQSADYDAATQTLFITFQSGVSYRYANVPPEVFTSLTRAESAGQYFTAHVRPQYSGEKVQE